MSPDELVEIDDLEVVDGNYSEQSENARPENADDEAAEPAEEEDIDETLGERLWGLTEMFPTWLHHGVGCATSGSVSSIKYLYSFSRSAMWIVFSSSVILMAPVIFEVERAQMEEMEKQQQRQILLGPNAAMAGGQSKFPMPLGPTQGR